MQSLTNEQTLEQFFEPLYLCSVEHFELDEIYSTHDRREVCRVLSTEFPALAVSVHWGTLLIENQFAKDLGGFDFHVM